MQKLGQQLCQGARTHLSAASGTLRLVLPYISSSPPASKKKHSSWLAPSSPAAYEDCQADAAQQGLSGTGFSGQPTSQQEGPFVQALGSSSATSLAPGEEAYRGSRASRVDKSTSISVAIPGVESVARLHGMLTTSASEVEVEIGISISQPAAPVYDASVPQMKTPMVAAAPDSSQSP